MVFWRKANEEEQPPPPLHEKIQTQFSNIVHRIGNSTMPWKVKNHALSDAEIKSRMAGIPIYKLGSFSNGDLGCGTSADPKRYVEPHFIGKPDALDYFERMKLNDDWPAQEHWQIFDAPLSNVVVANAEVRLVPESSQIRNAIEEKKKNLFGSNSNNFIRGVPVFKCDDFEFEVKTRGYKGFLPVYLRKEDLQDTITALNISPGNIEVASLEEIIQEMKDSSTNKSNDIIFIGPGGSTYWL